MSSNPVATPSAGAHDYDAVEEAQFRARMARVGADQTLHGRRRKPGSRTRGSGLGWMAWVTIDCGVVLLVVAVVVAWPPVTSCRHRDKTVGFYAGDSVEKCIRRGIAERLNQADQRVKMLLRGSGR